MKEPGSEPPLLIRGSKTGPPRGSTVASDRVGPTPTTGQGFEGQPPEGFHGRLRRRARDDQGYVRYITKARAALPRYPRTFPRPAGTIL
jgi:hypothetical protein